jgi:hypothetical protein
MPPVAHNITEAYLYDTQPMVSLTKAREAQAYVRVVSDQEVLPPWLSFKTDYVKSGNENTKQQGVTADLDTSRTMADVTIEKLLRLEKLDADWDGNDAAKPIGYSIKEARNFIRKLSPESIVPGATLHADGHAILFVRRLDIYAEIEFLGDNKIGYYARRGEEKWSEEFFFDGRSLPEGLSRIGFSL